MATVSNVVACDFIWDDNTQSIKSIRLEPDLENIVTRSLTVKYDIRPT